MELLHLLFGVNGRIGRAAFWLATLVSLVCLVLSTVAATTLVDSFVGSTLGRPTPADWMANETWVTLAVLILALIGLTFGWSLLAIQVKRWHDRDKTWLWLFVGLIPLVGPCGVIIECGLAPGVTSAKRFDSSVIKI